MFCEIIENRFTEETFWVIPGYKTISVFSFNKDKIVKVSKFFGKYKVEDIAEAINE